MDCLVLAENDRLQIALQIFQNLAVVARDALRRDPRDLGDDLLDLLGGDGLATPALGEEHLRRSRLVDDVDRLIGKLAVADIAMRQLDRGLERLCRVTHLVVPFVIGLEAAQNLDRIRNRRLVDVDLLEAADERPVLFEIVAIFLIGGGADAANVSALESRLQKVRGVHGAAARRSGADHGMDFVDEENGAGLRLELGEDRLEALLKIAAVARAGEKRPHVESIDLRAQKHLGHVALDDAPRQTLGDRRLADPGLAHVKGVVL
jgi:hypothetical protein